MDEYSVFKEKRRAKQFFLSLMFVAILVLGWYFPFLGFFIPLCMLIGISIGMRRGRKWCDWYCPRGSFYDALISRVSANKPIPPLFRKISFRVAILSLLMLVMGVNLSLRWPDAKRMGLFFLMLLTLTTSIGVLLALIWHSRAWCMLCPIGTIVNLIGKNKMPLKIDSERCVECKLCAKVCPVQIKPFSYKASGVMVVKDGDCLKCGSCVAVCPKKTLSF